MLHACRRLLISILLALLVVPLVPGVASAAEVTRLAGADRYETAVRVAEGITYDTPPDVFVATGENFPDALAVGPVAYGEQFVQDGVNIQRGPLLLVGRDDVPDVTAAYIEQLEPRRIYVIGGTGAISGDVEAELSALASDGTRRIAGASRYATAAEIATGFFSNPGEAIIATGENFPDALAGVPFARTRSIDGRLPILLVERDRLPDETAEALRELGISSATILGGEAAISSATASAIEDVIGSAPARIAGPNRFATAAQVASKVPVDSDEFVFVATGFGFPDALAGGAVAGFLGWPLLLVEQDDVPTEVYDELRRREADEMYVLGGTAVISEDNVARLERYDRTCETPGSGGC